MTKVTIEDSPSPKFKINSTDWNKVHKGFLIALGSFIVTLLIDVLPSVDLGNYQIVVMLVAGVAINTIRKYITNHQ